MGGAAMKMNDLALAGGLITSLIAILYYFTVV